MKGNIIINNDDNNNNNNKNNNNVIENNVRNGETPDVNITVEVANGTHSAVVSLQFQAAQASDD